MSDPNDGCGPCTGGCLISDCPDGRLFCVRCGLEFASEMEWRERAWKDSEQEPFDMQESLPG